MNKRIIAIALLLLSMLSLTFLLSKNSKWSDFYTTESEWNKIIETREETNEELIFDLKLNRYEIIYDQTQNKWYYSLLENNSSAYNPTVQYKIHKPNVKIAFKNQKIAEHQIESNEEIEFMAYTDNQYRIYKLACTTLPIMDIKYRKEETIGQDSNTQMTMTLFDNGKNATTRVIASDGTIHVRGGTTVVFPKKGYKLELTTESAGNNKRKNNISLLGMRQDNEWILYAGYNDQEKIRNVFSSNLWTESCGKNNSFGLTNGVEYKYVELFFNEEYWGLYALGYGIDSTQMQLAEDEKGNRIEYIFKKDIWSDAEETLEEGEYSLFGYELKGKESENQKAWNKLKAFHQTMIASKDINELYQITDINTSIDIYLFYNLIQGVDHVNDDGSNLKNTFLTLKNKNGQDVIVYTPWDFDMTFGNLWNQDAKNYTLPYEIPVTKNFEMTRNVITYIRSLNDKKINDLIVKRYNELRTDKWSDKSINRMIDYYENRIYLSGSYERDQQRWPDGTYQKENDKLDVFRGYVLERLKQLDSFIEKLSK